MERDAVNRTAAARRRILVRATWLAVLICAVLSAAPAHAWKPRTHVYIANVIRAGAVGPDGFPDMWTGQAFIHPNTGPWLRHLWASASADNSQPVWGFTYGYLVHCAGDVFAHDWVNSYAGRAFPSMLEV